MKERLTSKQLSVLVFMQEFFRENDQLPPQTAMKEHFGWKHEQSAAGYRQALVNKGYLEVNAVGKWRFSREGAST